MPPRFGEFLRLQLDQLGMSERELSRQAGLSTTTVHQIINRPDSTPAYDTCLRLAKALNVPPRLFLQMAGYEEVDTSENWDELVVSLALYLNSLPDRTRGYALEACWAVARILARASDEENHDT